MKNKKSQQKRRKKNSSRIKCWRKKNRTGRNKIRSYLNNRLKYRLNKRNPQSTWNMKGRLLEESFRLSLRPN